MEPDAPASLPFRRAVQTHLKAYLEESGRVFQGQESLCIDLHCHDRNSDVPDEVWGRILRLPETWLEPSRLHKVLRSRGTTAWTVTNHNNARSCWELREAGKDVLSAAEWTTHFPEHDLAIHVLVYGFSPEQEGELERRRRNIYDFLRYCRVHDLPVIQPHPLYFYSRGVQAPPEIFEKFALLFERFEVCNGQRDAWQNLLAWQWVTSLDRERLEGFARKHNLDPLEFCADPWTKALAGGSDDHFGVFAGLTGTRLQVPDLEARLASGLQPSVLALEALRAKRMVPFGRPGSEENLSVALLDYFSQAATEFQDPGLLRILLHKGDAEDKLWCLGVANGLAELRRHKYTVKFLKAWHACLQGKKPGVMLRLTVNKDYRPFLEHLERISKIRKHHPETLPEALGEAVPEMFRGMMRLMLKRAKKGLRPILERWEREGGDHHLAFDDWVEHLEFPSHFRVLLGIENLDKPRSMSSLQVSELLDELTFPTLMATLVAGASAVASHTLHGGRELLNELAVSCGGTPHPKRVLWLTDTFYDANGVSTVLQSVLAEARARELPLDFLICHESQDSESHLQVVRPLESFRVPGLGEQIFRIPDLLEILRLVQEGGYDRLVVSTEGIMGWVGLFLKKALRVPAHFFVHTDWLEYLVHNSRLDQRGLDRVRRLLRWYYHQWDGLFVLNRQHQAWLAGESMDVPPERLHLTAHWAAPEYHPADSPLPEGHPRNLGDHPTLLFAGRLSEEKGVLDVIEAWQTIKAQVPEARLVFAGLGPAEGKLRSIAPEAHFVGWVSRETLASWFRASTLMLFPSRFDTFGCAVLEALSCGLPVACYPVKGPADLVEDQANGLLCEDAQEMALRVVEYLRAPKDRQEAFRQTAIDMAQRYRATTIMDGMLADLGLPISEA